MLTALQPPASSPTLPPPIKIKHPSQPPLLNTLFIPSTYQMDSFFTTAATFFAAFEIVEDTTPINEDDGGSGSNLYCVVA